MNLTQQSAQAETIYSAATLGLAPAASATDVFTITGSATKTLRVKRLRVSGIATAAGAYTFQIVKRSGADLTGTSSAVTAVPNDSVNPAASATVLAYTVNPGTLGTLVGAVAAIKGTVTTAGAGLQTVCEFDFSAAPIVLRGITQVLALNLNAVTMAGGLLDVEIIWAEG